MNKTRVLLVGIYDTNTALLAPELLRAYAEQLPVAQAFEIRTLGLSIFSQSLARMERRIVAERPHIVGFSSYVWNHTIVRALAARVDAQVVVGGPMVAGDAREFFLTHPGVDIAVVGEGEQTFTELLEVWSNQRSLDSVAGIWTAELQTPDRQLLPELDRVPSPYERVFAENADLEWVAFETSRGCPHRCGFCTWGHAKGMRYHSVERVTRDLDVLLSHPTLERLYLCDSSLLVDPRRAKLILRHVIGRGTRTAIRFEFRAEQLDDEIIGLLAQLPDNEFNLGVQSFNPQALQVMQRRFSLSDFERAYRRLAAGVPDAWVTLDLIYGLPGDDLRGYESSLEHAMGLERVDWILTNPLLLLPGSDFARRRQELGIVVRDPDSLIVESTATFPRVQVRQAIKISFCVSIVYLNRRLRQALCLWARNTDRRYLEAVRRLFDSLPSTFVEGDDYPYMVPAAAQDFRRRNLAMARVVDGYPSLIERFDELTDGRYRGLLADYGEHFVPQYWRLRRFAHEEVSRSSCANDSCCSGAGGDARSA